MKPLLRQTRALMMIGAFTVATLLVVGGPAAAKGTPNTATGSTPVPVSGLLFGDEFNGPAGSEPNSTQWGAKSFQSSGSLANWNGWNNISENGSGDLVITAVKQSTGRWTTGWLTGKVGYSGPRYVEGRAKVACGTGAWNGATWEWDYPYGAGGLEIDEAEVLGRQASTWQIHLHNWTVSPQKSAGGPVSTGQALCSAFHTYGAAVYSDHVDFYLDGVKRGTLTASQIGLTSLTAFKDVVNTSLNMGGWGGTPTVSGPVSSLVDYIHVYSMP